MAYEDELLITYGLGYAFEKNKLLIVSEIEEKTILKKELDIMREINEINRFKEQLTSKCNLKFPKNYITNVEEVLEEKLTKTIPIITSIKAKNAKKQDYFMDEYIKRDLSQIILKKEGYRQKNSDLIKEYLDNCGKNSEENIEQKSLNYNKLILKIILTTSFGSEFSSFITKKGQAKSIIETDKFAEEELKLMLKNDYLVRRKYGELDFLNLLLFLEEWQRKHFSWDGKYTSLLFSINKDGSKYKGLKTEIKDYVISFIKEKKYLYFSFGKYNEDNIFVTLNYERYCNKGNREESSIQKNIVLEKKEGNLYQISSKAFPEIDLDTNKELGYLLSYDNDNVYISAVVYDKNHEKVIYEKRFNNFTSSMLKVLEDHFII